MWSSFFVCVTADVAHCVAGSEAAIGDLLCIGELRLVTLTCSARQCVEIPTKLGDMLVNAKHCPLVIGAWVPCVSILCAVFS